MRLFIPALAFIFISVSSSQQVVEQYADVVGEASGSEWRTTRGISYYRTVNKHTFLLHDGRARNEEEAILWHSGESDQVIAAFKAMNKTDREKIFKFLETL